MNPNWAANIDRRLNVLAADLAVLRDNLESLTERVLALTPEGFDELRVEIRNELAEMRAYVRRATGRRS